MARLLQIEHCYQCSHRFWDDDGQRSYCLESRDPNSPEYYRRLSHRVETLPDWCPLPKAEEPRELWVVDHFGLGAKRKPRDTEVGGLLVIDHRNKEATDGTH